MPDFVPVHRLSDTAFRTLINVAGNTPELWTDPDTDFAAVLAANGIEDPLEPATGVRARAPIHLEPTASGAPRGADRQALRFYANLQGMTPAKAADPNLWAWFNHFALHRYGIVRWPRRGETHLTQHIKLHWLTETRGTLYESNIAGRTWWLADTCLKAERHGGGAFDAAQALALFSGMAERYHYAMRFGFMRNPWVTAEYVRLLLHEAQGINSKGIRLLIQQINHEAGVRLIDSLSPEQLRHLFVSTAESVMRQPQFVTDRQYLKGVKPLKVLSLGAGTQSTVLALMAEQGYADMPRPDFAIFADTGWEPPAVYTHLEWLKAQLSYEVVTVTAGNIKEDLLQGRNPRGHRFLDIPTYLTLPDGRAAIAKRQCTSDYKLDPIRRSSADAWDWNRAGGRPRKSRSRCGWASAKMKRCARNPAATSGSPTAGPWWKEDTAEASCINGFGTGIRIAPCHAAPALAVRITATANGNSSRNTIRSRLPRPCM